MKARVRYFHSPDIDLDRFEPDDPMDFSFLLQAFIGPSDSSGEESLQLLVCTPNNLKRRLESEIVVFGHSLVIVETSDVEFILEIVKSRIERMEGSSWKQLANRLSRLGTYEFEDAL